MSALDPIAGISLERYADLCARMRDSGGDLEECAAVAAAHGVDRATWTAAMNGWNARMADPATAGAVATAYLPLYQAALARHGPVASASFEDFTRMSAMLQSARHGLDAMLRHYGLDAVAWSQVSMHWVTALTKDTTLAAKFAAACAAERARLDAGGAPAPRA